MKNKPIPDKVKGLRQRQRSDGTWRIWWEPNANERALGLSAEELDENKLTWSKRRANQINDDAEIVASGKKPKAKTVGGRTVSALIHEFKQSARWKKLKQATRDGYSNDFKFIDKKWGDHQVINFTKPIISTWYETIYETNGSYYAYNIIHAFSTMFTYAEVKLGWRPENSNPCLKIGMTVPDSRDRIATWDEIEAVLMWCNILDWPAMRCAILLAVFHGQRPETVRQARIDAFRKMKTFTDQEIFAWEFVRSKKGNYDALPVHEEAIDAVEYHLQIAKPDQTYLLLDDVNGKPFTKETFGKRWRKVRDKAAITCPSILENGNQLQFRDLRRTFSTMSRMAGVSKADIGDVLGNSAGIDPKLGETYMPPTTEAAIRVINSVKRPARKA